ncbi:hypothetical protein PRECH8_03260 [Insulibacter thermoxylanivorax]|uniref:SLH domain-containing protein n=1 Tax=Insulibacter thermoxylanivorax TaxID=2749268 RepID=A0A916QA76_9BACL|nr:S-layer homology domain-containing protein [Insulibacter thermoxylanivorax]GFR37030.1 hypothetical protein PRECH8_03260 [Insulibacter thermoxylanivorax]
MKLSKIAASLGLALAVGLFSPRSEAEAKTFSDVSADYWAKAEIEYLTDRGIINGYRRRSAEEGQLIGFLCMLFGCELWYG